MSDRRRIVDDSLYVHFLTFSTDQRRRWLDHDHPRKIMLGVLDDLLKRRSAKCIDFVLMPEHVHALIWLSKVGQLSEFVKEWKRRSSLEIRNWSQLHLSAYCYAIGTASRLWLPKYYAFEVYEPKKIEEKLAYMHMNPVRRGLVQRAVDWRWSSARWYEQGRDVGVLISWVE